MINERAGGGVTFDEYLNRAQFCINYPAYTDHKGNIIVDRVVKYESLTRDLKTIFDSFGIPFDGDLGVRAKAEYRKDRRAYQEVFTAIQKDVIEQAFAKEIELHGYTFENSGITS